MEKGKTFLFEEEVHFNISIIVTKMVCESNDEDAREKARKEAVKELQLLLAHWKEKHCPPNIDFTEPTWIGMNEAIHNATDEEIKELYS